MKKVITKIETMHISKLETLALYATKTKSGAICSLLISQYFERKEKFGWLAIDNCSHVLEWVDTRKDAITYMIELGFDVYCFNMSEQTDQKMFLKWICE